MALDENIWLYLYLRYKKNIALIKKTGDIGKQDLKLYRRYENINYWGIFLNRDKI